MKGRTQELWKHGTEKEDHPCGPRSISHSGESFADLSAWRQQEETRQYGSPDRLSELTADFHPL